MNKVNTRSTCMRWIFSLASTLHNVRNVSFHVRAQRSIWKKWKTLEKEECRAVLAVAGSN